MAQAFIIMQIGIPQLDRMCEEAIVPALKACGLDPKRVDKHNRGGLLKSEIIAFIESADIIVADLTNERPNCYLEVGYAMGAQKFHNLILTAREDHRQDSTSHQPGGSKIHFDLAGYDILFWDPKDLDGFRADLQKRIRRRQASFPPPANKTQPAWNKAWLAKHREAARAGLLKFGGPGFMEVRFALGAPKPSKSPKELLAAAEASQIKTFGWPIGITIQSGQYRPRPTNDGIVAEILRDDHSSYDYWCLARDGDFYLAKSLFEDVRGNNVIFFNTRIVRVSETLLYCKGLYSRLGATAGAVVNIGIRHGGLKGRTLGVVGNRTVFPSGPTTEDEVETEVRVPLSEIDSRLVELVKGFTSPIFELFDFADFDDSIYASIVDNFVAGKVT